MTTPTVVLITGANRGIGRGLVERYLLLENHIVIAANRNIAHATSQSLSDLPKASNSKLITVKIDAAVPEDAFAAIKELQEKHKVDHLDVVIPNAGLCYVNPTVAELKIEDLRAHTEPMVYGVVAIFQASLPLLRKSKQEPIFAPMGSNAGYIAHQLPFPNAAYGPPKAALNWLTVRINGEEPWLNAFILSPGFVQTELGNTGAQRLGLGEKAFVTIEDSCDGLVKVIKESSKEKHGGKVVLYDGVVEATF